MMIKTGLKLNKAPSVKKHAVTDSNVVTVRKKHAYGLNEALNWTRFRHCSAYRSWARHRAIALVKGFGGQTSSGTVRITCVSTPLMYLRGGHGTLSVKVLHFIHLQSREHVWITFTSYFYLASVFCP